MSHGHFRTSARYRIRTPIAIRVTGSSDSLSANLVDMGLSGACLELDEALVAGMDADVEIKSPLLWDPLRLRARIVWAKWNSETEVFRAGLKFHHDNPAAVMSLFDLIASETFDP